MLLASSFSRGFLLLPYLTTLCTPGVVEAICRQNRTQLNRHVALIIQIHFFPTGLGA